MCIGKKRFIPLLIFSVFIMTAYAKVPSWVDDSNSVYDEYPEDLYIAEVGYGDSIESAQSDAISRISQYFVSHIRTNFSDRSEFTSNGLDISVAEEVINETYISSQVNLFAIEYSKAYKDKKLKQYCIVAYIDRSKAWEIFEPKISTSAKKLEKLYKNASEVEDALDQYMAYKSASLATADFIECYEFGKKLAPSQCSKFDTTNNIVASLPSVMKKLQNQCKFTVTVTGDYNDIVSRKISSLLNKLGFATQKSAAPYEVVSVVTIDMSKSDSEFGTTYTIYPGIELTMGAVDNAVFSYSKNLKKVTNFSSEKAKIQAFQKLEKELESTLISEFTAFADSK